jgi:hypothetical protein
VVSHPYLLCLTAGSAGGGLCRSCAAGARGARCPWPGALCRPQGPKLTPTFYAFGGPGPKRTPSRPQQKIQHRRPRQNPSLFPGLFSPQNRYKPHNPPRCLKFSCSPQIRYKPHKALTESPLFKNRRISDSNLHGNKHLREGPNFLVTTLRSICTLPS